MDNFLEFNKVGSSKKKLLSFLDEEKNAFDTKSLSKSIKINQNNFLVKTNTEKVVSNLPHLKQYDFKLIKSNEKNLSHLSHELKLNRLNNLKVKLFQKLRNKKKEIKKEVQIKNKFSKNIVAKKAVSRLSNKHKLDDYLHKYKSIYKKITNKLKYKLESRFKKFKLFNLAKKKMKKQEKKKKKKRTIFLNQHYNSITESTSFIEIIDYKNYFSTAMQEHFKIK